MRVDLDRVRAAVLEARPQQVARDVARGDPVAAQEHSPRCTKSWQTPAPASSRSLDRASRRRWRPGGTRSGRGSARDSSRTRRQRRSCARAGLERARRARVARARRRLEQELAAGGLVGGGPRAPPRPRPAARPGSVVTTRARTSIDRWSCGRETPNSMHLGAEVVEVAVQARLGVERTWKSSTRCVGVVAGLHPQRVEVVGDRRRRSGTRSGSGWRSSYGDRSVSAGSAPGPAK